MNVFGLIYVIKIVFFFIRKNGGVKIINISSISGLIGFLVFFLYVFFKFVIEGFIECLWFEFLFLGIDVVLIEFGSYKILIWEMFFFN